MLHLGYSAKKVLEIIKMDSIIKDTETNKCSIPGCRISDKAASGRSATG